MEHNYSSPDIKVIEIKARQTLCQSGGLNYSGDGYAGGSVSKDDMENGGEW